MCELMNVENVIQGLILLALVWYAWDTRKIRKASQKQIETSQKQIEISQEQNEIMQKPCLVPLVRKDRSREVILFSDTEMVLDDAAGGITLLNIGNGPAFNVEYEAQGENPENFLPYILNQSNEGTTLSLEQLRGSFTSYQDREAVKLSLFYDSLSGRRYESNFVIRRVIPSDLLVVGNCQFREILPNPHK